MTAASNSDARKRNAAQVDPVEVVARAMYESTVVMSTVKFADRHADYKKAFYNEAEVYVAALRAEGLLS